MVENRPRPFKIHWAHVPSGVVFMVIVWRESGPAYALILAAGGIGLGVFLEWRARRREREG
jgi:hypothetical protein